MARCQASSCRLTPSRATQYRQEFLAGEAEDMAEVLRIEPDHDIGLGTYEDVVVTEDWTPLEPEVIENKWYAPGVGMIAGANRGRAIGDEPSWSSTRPVRESAQVQAR